MRLYAQAAACPLGGLPQRQPSPVPVEYVEKGEVQYLRDVSNGKPISEGDATWLVEQPCFCGWLEEYPGLASAIATHLYASYYFTTHPYFRQWASTDPANAKIINDASLVWQRMPPNAKEQFFHDNPNIQPEAVTPRLFAPNDVRVEPPRGGE